MNDDQADEILELMSKLRHEGLTPLNVILQGTSLLLDGKKGEVSSEQRKLLTMIQRSVAQATHSWYTASDQLRVWLDQPASDWTAVSLNDLFFQIQTYFREYRRLQIVWPGVPEYFPRVRANSDLKKGLTLLLDSLPVRHFLDEYPPEFKAENSSDGVQILIFQRLPSYSKQRLATLYGSELGTAVFQKIVAQHDGQFDIIPGNECVSFRIQLPVSPQ